MSKDARIAYRAYYTILHDTELRGWLNGYDPDGELLVAEVESDSSRGTVTIYLDGSLVYVPYLS